MGSTTRALLFVAVGITAWASSLSAVGVSTLDDYGLPPALPLTWYLALGLILGGIVLAVLERASWWVLGLHLGAIVLILYATVPLITDVPQYSWTYKHIAVTQYLDLNGRPDLDLDIYNRWPGFFGLTALGGSVAGVTDPTIYAAWAEPFFAGLAALLVAAVARAFVASRAVAAMAALIFLLANWVGQSYFAPQALGFTLALAVVALLLSRRRPVDGRAARALVRVGERVGGRGQDPDLGTGAREVSRPLLVVALLVHATLVPTHQLTPYLMLLGLLALVAVDALRPRWSVAFMALVTGGYLAINFGYVQENYEVFSSLNPLANAEHSAGLGEDPMPGIVWAGRAGWALTGIVLLGAALTTWRLARSGDFAYAVPLVALVIAPVIMFFGQSYGGEAIFRVTLFTLPWCAVLMAWGLSFVERPGRRVLLTTATVAAMAVLFVPAFYGRAAVNFVQPGEVRASLLLDARAPAGSVIMPAAPGFPTRSGPHYDRLGNSREDRPNILRLEEFRHRPLGASDVPAVIAELKEYGRRGFVVFSTSQERYARLFQLTPPHALRDLERAVANSTSFRLWYRNDDARVYQLVTR